MNKEQIEDLIMFIASKRKNDTLEIAEIGVCIADYFEQNPAEPLFEPNWNDAPADAVKASVFVQFYDKDNVSLQCRRDLISFKRPKPPAPVVLAAAAPDLLELLIDLIEKEYYQLNAFTINRIQSAIAKATGDTNDTN